MSPLSRRPARLLYATTCIHCHTWISSYSDRLQGLGLTSIQIDERTMHPASLRGYQKTDKVSHILRLAEAGDIRFLAQLVRSPFPVHACPVRVHTDPFA